MPPKKKGAKDKNAAEAKERLARAEAEVLSLNRLLDVKTHEASEARRSERAWRQRADAAEASLQQLRADMMDVSADMKRQSEVGAWMIAVWIFGADRGLSILAAVAASCSTNVNTRSFC